METTTNKEDLTIGEYLHNERTAPYKALLLSPEWKTYYEDAITKGRSQRTNPLHQILDIKLMFLLEKGEAWEFIWDHFTQTNIELIWDTQLGWHNHFICNKLDDPFEITISIPSGIVNLINFNA